MWDGGVFADVWSVELGFVFVLRTVFCLLFSDYGHLAYLTKCEPALYVGLWWPLP